MLKRNPHATPVVDALTDDVDLMNWLFEGRMLTEIYARGQTGVLKEEAGNHDVPDVSYSVLTYDDGAVGPRRRVNETPEKYPALGHAARVEVLGTGGVMDLDDDHTDQLTCTAKPACRTYILTMWSTWCFCRAARRATGRWGIWGDRQRNAGVAGDHLATGRSCTLATAQDVRATLEATLESNIRCG